jgi:hypothetical protein
MIQKHLDVFKLQVFSLKVTMKTSNYSIYKFLVDSIYNIHNSFSVLMFNEFFLSLAKCFASKI